MSYTITTAEQAERILRELPEGWEIYQCDYDPETSHYIFLSPDGWYYEAEDALAISRETTK